MDRGFSGPARVTGATGTGKTAVALHRAVRLARASPTARVLLTSFSAPLAAALDRRMAALSVTIPAAAARVTVSPVRAVADELYQLAFGGRATPASDEHVQDAVTKAVAAAGDVGYRLRFVLLEWRHVVDAWQIADVDAYARQRTAPGPQEPNERRPARAALAGLCGGARLACPVWLADLAAGL